MSALLRKDLQLELRSFEAVPAMLLFTVSAFVLFRFGLDREALAGDLAAGVLWVTLLLAAVLGMNRLFVAEREQGGFDGFLMAPVDRTAMFVAKALLLFGFLVAVELVAVPAFVILLLEPGPGQALPELLAVLVLADAGHRRRGHAGGRAGGADARARPDRAADGPAAAHPRRHRRRGGHRATVRGGWRRPAPGPLAGGPRPL